MCGVMVGGPWHTFSQNPTNLFPFFPEGRFQSFPIISQKYPHSFFPRNFPRPVLGIFQNPGVGNSPTPGLRILKSQKILKTFPPNKNYRQTGSPPYKNHRQTEIVAKLKWLPNKMVSKQNHRQTEMVAGVKWSPIADIAKQK